MQKEYSYLGYNIKEFCNDYTIVRRSIYKCEISVINFLLLNP